MSRVSGAVAWSVVMLAGAGLACSGPGGSGSSTSSSSGGGQLTPEQFVQGLLDAQCDYEDRCEMSRGRQYSSREACLESLDNINLFAQAFLGSSYVAYIARNMTLPDPARAQQCLDAMRTTAACTMDDPLLETAECRGAYAWSSGRTEGQACSGSDFFGDNPEGCQPDLTCFRANQAQCGVCVERGAVGASCVDGGQCISGLCDGPAGSMTCTARPGLNQPCEGLCSGNLTCTGEMERTCQKRAGLGQACDFNCFSDLSCEPAGAGRTCVGPLADGAACSVGSDGAGCRVVCQLSSTMSLTGTCASPETAPALGQPCAFDGNTPLCGSGTYAAITYGGGGVPTGCECRARLAPGQPCMNSSDCATGACAGGMNGMPGTCGPLLQNGQPCNAGADCVSGTCEYNNVSMRNECTAAAACN